MARLSCSHVLGRDRIGHVIWGIIVVDFTFNKTMSWQDKYRERYEERLRNRWTQDGERILMAITGTSGMPSETYLQHVDKYYAELYNSTRDICGND